ncbi:hypothetical protein ACFZAR_30420 [Streptomyces sp. NPDC008222]
MSHTLIRLTYGPVLLNGGHSAVGLAALLVSAAAWVVSPDQVRSL